MTFSGQYEIRNLPKNKNKKFVLSVVRCNYLQFYSAFLLIVISIIIIIIIIIVIMTSELEAPHILNHRQTGTVDRTTSTVFSL